mmetsp:Transcript_12629/g.34022  ORF Transcript_12629/g.34022 Transcript_12629/m.34022 type:complete len:205 (-) Transcript_12629:66-680(-)
MAEPDAKRPRVRAPALAPHLTLSSAPRGPPSGASPTAAGGGSTRPAPGLGSTKPAPPDDLFAGLPEAASSTGSTKDAQKIPEASRPVTHVRVLHLLKKHTGSRRPSSWREKVIKRTLEEATYELKELRKKIAACDGKEKMRAEFERLARKESDCSSAKKGGDLGKFGRGQMQPTFDEASFALKLDELSGIVSSDSGVHIILRLE